MKTKYSEAFAFWGLFVVWAFVAQTLVYALGGATGTTLGINAIISIALIPTLIWALGSKWPGIEPGWSWSRFWAGFFGLFRIGYERPGLGQVPFAILAAVGSVAGACTAWQQKIIMESTGGTLEMFPLWVLEFVVVGAILYPVLGVLLYGIGYLFGGRRQRKLATT